MADLKTVLTETLREALVSEHPFNGGVYPEWFREWIDKAAPKAADRLLGLPGVAVTQLPELSDIPEPAMARFDRLPFPMRMRVAAGVMDAVNERHRREYPTAGISANESISSSSMR